MTKRILFVIALLLSVRMVTATAPTVGIVGDSNSDEYRANDNRGGAYAATTLNWAEQLATYRGIDLGAWGSYAEPRRSGYAYNWARSASLSCDTVAQAQGLAAQHVQYAIIFTGANDFNWWNGTYDAVYSGAMSDAGLQAKIAAIISCLTTTVDTLQASGANVILSNFGDPGLTVSFVSRFPDANKRARVSGAIQQINSQLAALAASRSATLADADVYAQSILSMVSAGVLMVGGEPISMASNCDEPHCFLLGDTIHAGTVVNGIIANFFLNLLNIGASPFTDAEILAHAGVGLPATATPTATPMPTVTVTNTAVPTATFTVTPSRTPTATPTVTATPNTLKTVRLQSRPNGSRVYAPFDGIVENGTFIEVTSGRFTYSAGWTFYSTQGRNGSPAYATTQNAKTVTFTTAARAITIQTFKASSAGYIDVYVNNVLVATYNGNAVISQTFDYVVSIPQ